MKRYKKRDVRNSANIDKNEVPPQNISDLAPRFPRARKQRAKRLSEGSRIITPGSSKSMRLL